MVLLGKLLPAGPGRAGPGRAGPGRAGSGRVGSPVSPWDYEVRPHTSDPDERFFLYSSTIVKSSSSRGNKMVGNQTIRNSITATP